MDIMTLIRNDRKDNLFLGAGVADASVHVLGRH